MQLLLIDFDVFREGRENARRECFGLCLHGATVIIADSLLTYSFLYGGLTLGVLLV